MLGLHRYAAAHMSIGLIWNAHQKRPFNNSMCRLLVIGSLPQVIADQRTDLRPTKTTGPCGVPKGQLSILPHDFGHPGAGVGFTDQRTLRQRVDLRPHLTGDFFVVNVLH